MTLIRRDKKENSYYRLQQQTLEDLQQFSGKVWTDFNSHDPGITIADVFNYALYELEFQLRFPPDCYIERGKKDPWREIGLLPAEELFDRSPVSPYDYEELIGHFFPEVKRCKVTIGEDELYHIRLDVEELPAGINLTDEVTALYHRYRNLGENLGSVVVTPVTGQSVRRKFDLLHVKWEKPQNRERTDLKLPAFDSILSYFPECYGLMKENPDSRQLKDYLSLYDSLLATISKQVKEVGVLLHLATGKCPREKARYLDCLDRLYGTSTRRWFRKFPLPEQNRKRGKLLLQWPGLQRDRFRSVNLQEPEEHQCGILRWLSAVTGLDENTQMSISGFLSHYSLRLLDDSLFFRQYKYKLQIDILRLQEEQQMETIPFRPVRFHEKDFQSLYLQMHILWHNLLYESFLVYGTNINNYYIHRQWGQGYILLFRIPGQNEWLSIGQFFEKDHLIHMANLFCSFIRSITNRCHPVYLIEHRLLSEEKKDGCRLTFVFPRFTKAVYSRHWIESLLKERIPAHLSVRFIWLKMSDMTVFEQLYFRWRNVCSEPAGGDLLLCAGELNDYVAGWLKKRR